MTNPQNTTIATNGKIYAIGGTYNYPADTVADTVEEYDPATDSWMAKASMPTARMQLAVVTASNGKIYAIGGASSSFASVLATVEEYDPSTDSWAAKAPMPTARLGSAAVAAPNGKIYAIGGADDVSPLATVEEATGAGTAPTPTPTMVPGVSGVGLVVLAGSLLVVLLWMYSQRGRERVL